MKIIRVALVGKTGHGKSSTGNTLLRSKLLQESDGSMIGSEFFCFKKARINDQLVKVYDTPGNISLILSKVGIRREMDRMMEAAGEIDVFILTYSFTARFIAEEKQAIDELEEIFGPTFLEKHGIVVVTHGDNFDQNNSGQTFEQWCEWCSPEFRNLREKVNGRMLLVYNKGDFVEGSKRMTSSKRMLEMITTLMKNKESYKKRCESLTKTRLHVKMQTFSIEFVVLVILVVTASYYFIYSTRKCDGP